MNPVFKQRNGGNDPARGYKTDPRVYVKAWQMKAIPFGRKMPAELILLVIPENGDSLEDTPLLLLLLLSTQVINCL